MTHNIHSPGDLALGNQALMQGNFIQAMTHFVQGLTTLPGLASTLRTNFHWAQLQYKESRTGEVQPHVMVCTSELSHNTAGRAYALAKIYQSFSKVDIIGSVFAHGDHADHAVWSPILKSDVACHSFVAHDESLFLQQAAALVAAHPCEVVHLCRPRAPALFFGMLYKLIWNAHVLMDIEDEELALVGAQADWPLNDYLQHHTALPAIHDLLGQQWTRLAVGLARSFDGLTVSNPALQRRYGGDIIRQHVRLPKRSTATPEFKSKVCHKYGIAPHHKVILFLGTPRRHFGLEAVANALTSLGRHDVTLMVIGQFLDDGQRQTLQANPKLQCRFLGDKALGTLSDLATLAEFCILPQHSDPDMARFQVSTKLLEALSAGIPVLAWKEDATADMMDAGVVLRMDDVRKTLESALEGSLDLKGSQARALAFCRNELGLTVNAKRLERIIRALPPCPAPLFAELQLAIDKTPGVQVWQTPTLPQPGALTTLPPNAVPLQKLPITVLIITWDVGHNPLGRSYMLAEVVQRVVRHCLLVGFQFARYGDEVWEPLRTSQLPVIVLPGSDLPAFHDSLKNMASRIHPDVVIACKPRLPSLELGLMIKEQWGCPLIIDMDDHELSFFNQTTELTLNELAAMPAGSAATQTEPYAELWTRLTQSLCKSADDIMVSNLALQHTFGGTLIPHVRDEHLFDPTRFDAHKVRLRYGIPIDKKVILFFGTPRSHKGLDTLASAVGQMDDDNFCLVVVGTSTDQRVTAQLDNLAQGRVIYLPNQPFASVPEIMVMADVVCLPQDEDHAISQYQLPAKAIDAIAMGIPLLVSNTPPLMQLVDDQVAQLVDPRDISGALRSAVTQTHQQNQRRATVRSRFLERYSYAAAALQIKLLLERCLARTQLVPAQSTASIVKASRHVLGLPDAPQPLVRLPGVDIVLFWKQNDTGLYGRRHDMVIKYLASRPDVRKVVVFDAPISEYDLIRRQQASDAPTQDSWIYVGTYEKLMGLQDTDKISFNVFIHPPGTYRTHAHHAIKPHLHEGYFPFIESVLSREGVNPLDSIFWVYPKNYSAPDLIRHFKPRQVVVDVVDDHRAWPQTSEDEKKRLTDNYRETLALADMALTNCEPMQRSMQEFFPGILLVPNGCDSTPPAVIPKHCAAYESFCNWRGKTIGYVGNLEAKIDITLLDKIATHFPDCQLVLIGSTHANPDVTQLMRHPNVLMPGVIPYKEIGAWVSKFDVGLVPHLNTAMTQNMNPLKVFVYLAFGVPVVATMVENIDVTSSLVSIAKHHDDFIHAIQNSIAKNHVLTDIEKQSIANMSWSSKLKFCVDSIFLK